MDELELLLEAGGGVIASRDHRPVRRKLSRWAAAGRLVRVMRGIYVRAGAEQNPEFLVRAVAVAHPDAIFTGLTAAWLHGGVDAPPERITAVHRGRSSSTRSIQLVHGELPDELWRERADGLRVMTRVMTALDVVPALGAELIDRLMVQADDTAALLRRFWAALIATPKRTGNPARHRILARTGTNPWSEAERRLHDLLDEAGITGWSANADLFPEGTKVTPDVLFAHHWLVVEVDGYQFHSDPEAFRRDRRRQNLLVLAGWRVLRYTWDDLKHYPRRVIEQIQRMLQ